ncbi:hypothetical protein LT493_36405 [Streptomyces tricolor]|nr:hypothetical protein [Streptomyces tricolor]
MRAHPVRAAARRRRTRRHRPAGLPAGGDRGGRGPAAGTGRPALRGPLLPGGADQRVRPDRDDRVGHLPPPHRPRAGQHRRPGSPAPGCASWTTPSGPCRRARRASCSSADPGWPAGTTAVPRRRRRSSSTTPSPTSPAPRMYRTGDLVRRNTDDRLDFLGRTDDQVKVRGHRVELGAVEAALRPLPGVQEAAVLLRRARRGPDRLRRLAGGRGPGRAAPRPRGAAAARDGPPASCGSCRNCRATSTANSTARCCGRSPRSRPPTAPLPRPRTRPTIRSPPG